MRVIQLKKCKRVIGLSFAPDGEQFAAITSGGEDHVDSVAWLDVASGLPRRVIELDVERCGLSRNHRRIAVAYSRYARPRGVESVRWAELTATGDPKWTDLPGVPHRDIFVLEFSSDGNRLAVGCAGKTLSRGDWHHAAHIAPLGRGKAITLEDELFIGAIAFSSDDQWLALAGGAGGDREVRIHRLPATDSPVVYAPKATRTRRIVFAPDRPVLAVLAGKQVVLLSAADARPITVLEGHSAQVNDAAFSPNGKQLITVAHDGSARIWDAVSGSPITAFAWPTGRLTAVAIAPDGLTAIAAGEKGQFVTWDLEG